MNGHVHKEMIKVKADNMELVVFFKSNEDNEWLKIIDSNELPAFYEHYKYFLCHPKHEKECLHWLNGDEVQVMDNNWVNVYSIKDYPWEEGHDFMDGESKIRIKPRKEKRWIAVRDNKVISNRLFESENEARVICGCAGHDAQFIEIEVEV